ncbi:MAG TPA: class I SAM-dependent methyltransferase [Acidimicrobiia bacterium]|nr:class I SAM-dependent methyltransferase [Acidimicrobiia bacterium]
MEPVIVDENRAELFGERILNVLNDSMLSLMLSVGHRTGLFDAMSTMAPATSAEIAEQTGLVERYVREWLAAMTVGRVVEYDPPTKGYHLPPEHAATLTRASGPDNMAMFMQYTALLGSVEGDIVRCFHHGGGVPYSAFPDFHRVMAEESGQVIDATLLDVTLPLASGLVDRLRSGIDVADVGCGSGHAINVMAGAFPASRFTGFDFSDEAIDRARSEANALGLVNARFERRDVSDLGETEAFDFITTFDAIHDQARPDLVLAGIRQALRPGGLYLCIDIAASSNLEENIDHPIGMYLYAASTMHCMTVSLALDGMGLGTAWGQELATRMLTDAGFADIEVRHVEGDIQNVYYLCRTE